MDRYQRVDKPRPETPINENEIRITSQGRMRNYITYATTLLQEKGSNEIVLKAMGRAINKTVMIAELIKRRIAGLHQNTSICSTDITDVWEPLEEGLLPYEVNFIFLETTRHVSVITITLSKQELDTSSTGIHRLYQPPIPIDQVKPWTEYDYEGEGSPGLRGRGRGGRGRGRGRGNYNNGVMEYNGDGWDGGRGYGGRGRGRGRGRGYRGRGRGGYGGGDMQQESGGYNDYGGPMVQPAPGRGRGQGRGRGRGYGRGREPRSVGPVNAAA
ncbi:DNA/RNA-binding protein Alba-like [Dillenia turbinata]|uniref:DNA/RNA-binding protein Alba-like n=1 Tax=Dillenia turbinata TaxID=194707 RepID=A0AAN8W6G9_9MAGN